LTSPQGDAEVAGPRAPVRSNLRGLSPKLKKLVRSAAIAGVVVFVALQFFPAKRLGVHTEDIGTNPKARFTLDAPAEVQAVLHRACYDCHTNETRWPLYARFAPGSWLMARDVHNGRNHMNFSDWGDHDEDERRDDLETCWEQVESGAMPPWFYVYPLHLGARLSAADKALLKSYFVRADAKKADKGEKGPVAADPAK
jgi:hypothetical protein